MLAPLDKQMLDLIVKEFEEAPYSDDLGFLARILLGCDVNMLEMVLRDDDGYIDWNEDGLLGWFMNEYEQKMYRERDFHSDVKDYFFNYLESKG